jgi:RNA polymerase sigma-70 factor, ECF subfamily
MSLFVKSRNSICAPEYANNLLQSQHLPLHINSLAMDDNSVEESIRDVGQTVKFVGAGPVLRFKAEPTEETFFDVVQAISPRMLRYFRACGADPAQAEDLLQDFLLSVFRGIQSLRDPALFWAWSYKIARNLYLQHIRRSATRMQTVPIEDVILASKMDDPWQQGSFNLWMRWLDIAEQNVLILRFVEDMEYHEIAETLGIPIGTVKWRIFQAKKKLLKRLT